MQALRWPVLVLSLLALCGCKHYDYFLVEPKQFAQRLSPQPVTLHYVPLDYRIAEYHKHVAMSIENPTDQAIEMLANRSYLIDPHGTSHPVNARMIAPHSFVPLTLPPVPLTYQVYAPYSTYAPPWWWSPYRYPFAYDWYDWWYEPFPLSYSVQVRTPNDWAWHAGPVQLHLSYDQQGKVVEHHFLFERRKRK